MDGMTGFCELRRKEVISTCDGRRLGRICDAEIELCAGRILTLTAEADNGGFFSRGELTVFGWDAIERIGDDTVLVRIEHKACGCREDTAKPKKRRRFWE